jgi:hypothetical protein
MARIEISSEIGFSCALVSAYISSRAFTRWICGGWLAESLEDTYVTF